ncbi:MAG TPA: sortase [Acidimicrobiales bacterium]|nr:sortase [Acidimicrobiales bacterium]
MRRRTLLVAVLTAAVAGCSSPAPRPQPEPVAPEVPFFATPARLPTTPPHLDPTRPPPGPPLPSPVPIPVDSYAPEPVREIGTIEIPAIGLRHRMFQGVTLHNIDRGPSHWTGSALPGELGNAVFAGHRATHDQPFRDIDALDPGDTVTFTVNGARSTYEVTGHLIVGPSDSWIADQTHDHTATLYACHPVGSMAERYVVRLRLVGA